MNELQTFANNEFGAVRSMMIGDVPRFVGRDVAVALGYSNPRKTLGAHVDDEDKNKNTVTIRDGIQGEPQHDYHQRIRAVQPDFLQQAPPAAKRFKHWVTNEVLSAIRKTGKYKMTATQDEVPPRELTSDDYFRTASIVATCKTSACPMCCPTRKWRAFQRHTLPPNGTDGVHQSGRHPDDERRRIKKSRRESH